MLRELKTAFLRPRLIGFKATAASGVATLGSGLNEVTVASSGTGIVTSTFKQPFNRTAITVGALSSADVAAGGYIQYNATPGGVSTQLKTCANGGSADDGTVYGLTLGYDSSDATRYRKDAYVVHASRRVSRLLGFQVNTATSSIVIGGRHATLSKTGTGDVTLTLRTAFGNANVVAIPTIVGTTALSIGVESTSASQVRIKIFNSGGTATDATFNLLVFGSNDRDGTYQIGGSVENEQRKPRLIAGHIRYDGSGVPSIIVGTGDYTLVDTATGRATLTYKEAFRREAIVVCTLGIGTSVWPTVTASSASAVEIRNHNAAGTLQDPGSNGGAMFLALGSDDPSEY